MVFQMVNVQPDFQAEQLKDFSRSVTSLWQTGQVKAFLANEFDDELEEVLVLALRLPALLADVLRSLSLLLRTLPVFPPL